MRNRKKMCLLIGFLAGFVAVSAQGDKEGAMLKLREYYSKNMSTYPIRAKIKNAETYLKQLNAEGQFSDLIDYERQIHDRKWLTSVGFKDQQAMGLFLADAMERLWVIANHYRRTREEQIPDNFWKAVLRYGDIETHRQPNDRFHASCFAIPKAACGIYYALFKQMDVPNDGLAHRKAACGMLKQLAMQSWTQPKRNDDTDKNVVSIERFRHHVWWVGGNALAYRPLLETAVLMDSIPMVDVIATVAKGGLSNASQSTYHDAFWNEGFTADGAGWGHGLQSLVWGYPIHGASSALNMLWTLRGTPWGQTLDRGNVDALLNFYRGSTFYYYKGFIPPCLDRYSMVWYEGKSAHIPYYEMMKASVTRWPQSFTSEEVDELKQLVDEAGKDDIRMEGYPEGHYNGTRWFYNNDDLIKRTSDYYIMVNMASSRCDGLESANNFADEYNMYQNDGLTFFQRKGDEYRKVIGAMDLTAWPGVTAREGQERLKPFTNWRGFCSRHNYAGAATHGGKNAVAGFVFEKMDASEKENRAKMVNPVAFGVKAYKAYFMLGDYMVALGAGVTNLQPEQEGIIRTTIEQTAHEGKVWIYDGKEKTEMSPGANPMVNAGKSVWVMQEGGFAYKPLAEFTQKAYSQIETRKNEWLKRNLSNKGKQNLPETADILRVWVDHGREVKDGTYGYVVYAGQGLPERKDVFSVLRNDTTVQAIQSVDRKVLEAVFYSSTEKLKWQGLQVEVSHPCVLLVERDGKKCRISVTDPTMNTKLKEIVVRIGGKNVPMALTTGKDCGKSVDRLVEMF